MKRLLAAAALPALIACGGAPTPAPASPGPSPTLAITHATVLDGTPGPALSDTTILVEGDRIVAMGPSASTAVPAGVRTLDATGRFVIPGLWDMHVHLVNRPDKGLAEAILLPLHVMHGVVGVRDMGSDFERIKALRGEVASGARRGPTIVLAGPFVDGPQPPGPVVIPVADEAQARAAVALLKAGGADFVKVQAALTPKTYEAVAQESLRLGIPFAGHVPEAVDASVVVEAGQRSLEHVSPALTGDAGILLSCSRDAAALRAQLLALEEDSAKEGADVASLRVRDGDLKARLIESFDAKKCDALFARMVALKTRVVPTLVWSRAQLPQTKTEGVDDPPTIPRSMRERWKKGRDAYLARIGDGDFARNRKVAEIATSLVRAMHRAGVPLLVGTDSFDAWVVPGLSVHRELELLVQAGISPQEALVMATRDAAAFVGQGATRGTIATGKLAELLVLESDPRVDIRSTARIETIVLRGAVIDRAERERMKAEIEAAAGAM
jgi:imidazolonepropionase-like amidohydrolase